LHPDTKINLSISAPELEQLFDNIIYRCIITSDAQHQTGRRRVKMPHIPRGWYASDSYFAVRPTPVGEQRIYDDPDAVGKKFRLNRGDEYGFHGTLRQVCTEADRLVNEAGKIRQR